MSVKKIHRYKSVTDAFTIITMPGVVVTVKFWVGGGVAILGANTGTCKADADYLM